MHVRPAAFSVLAAFLVLGNAFLLTGDPSQFTRSLSFVLGYRSAAVTNIDDGGFLHLLWSRIFNYAHSFRKDAIASIFFSTSPLLCVVVFAAFIANALANRSYFRAAAMAACMLLGYWNFLAALTAALLLVCLTFAKPYPLLVSISISGAIILGPVFAIDTHTTYLLPATIAMLFVVLAAFLSWLSSHSARPVAWSIVGVLAVLGIGNFAGGAYLCAKVVQESELLGHELETEIRSDSIVTNSRHAFDLFFFANAG